MNTRETMETLVVPG